MIKARASVSKVYLYFMKKGRQARHRIPRNSCSTLYSTLPDNLLKDKLVDLIERTFQREGCPYIACNDRNDFFTSDAVRNYMYN